ncbi:anthranilate phosphoribosyltransferase [Sporolactobacillus terrae]|uniref:anthranilate phosphoribosyltransferase n=1 Tax=Sporolactobacillus terrae TaxID=269673 RepID=UPI00048C0910|nr:anthranilate phosphoribosyltransferase [Sporolactobacillus terrae]
MFQATLKELVQGKTLSEKEAEVVMNDIMDGKVDSNQISAYLALLSLRGETADELTGSVRGMRAHALPLKYTDPLLDIVGTGGDGMATFNLSTAAAIVLSSLGVNVAKHGNRSVSSTSGAADALEALGISIQSTPASAAALLEQTHMCFLFAPLYHASMRYAIEPRKSLGFRTIFNQLGPLTNPAAAAYQLLGVYSRELAERYAEVLVKLNTKRALVVTGSDGMDELTIAGKTDAYLIEKNQIHTFTLIPEDVGLTRGTIEELRVHNPQESAKLIETVLTGTSRNASAINAVLLNAGAGLFTAGKTKSIAEGVRVAREAIQSGRAAKQLQLLRAKTKVMLHA